MVFEQKIACIRRDSFARDGTAHFSTVELRRPAGTNSEAPDCSLAPELASVNPFLTPLKAHRELTRSSAVAHHLVDQLPIVIKQ
jgi:hypothetical protein